MASQSDELPGMTWAQSRTFHEFPRCIATSAQSIVAPLYGLPDTTGDEDDFCLMVTRGDVHGVYKRMSDNGRAQGDLIRKYNPVADLLIDTIVNAMCRRMNIRSASWTADVVYLIDNWFRYGTLEQWKTAQCPEEDCAQCNFALEIRECDDECPCDRPKRSEYQPRENSRQLSLFP